MKKNPFLQGTMIATLSIIITKTLGIIYVIPFYALIGAKGGALYGYAYSIYSIFLNLSSIGIPLAISKLISEYNALGYYQLKERAYKTGKYFILLLSVISFFILIISAPYLALLFIGNTKGGNTLEDVTLVIRVVGSAILIVPVLSVTRGYLQGHRFITTSSISQIIEQVIRVLIIIVGSFLVIKVFSLPIKIAVAMAILGASTGALVAYLYLIYKIKNDKESLNRGAPVIRTTFKMTDKDLLAKLLTYAIPFIFSSLVLSIYHFVDLSTVVRTMVNKLNYDTLEAETAISILITWGLKLNMIIMAIATGLTTNLIPNITKFFVRKEEDKLKFTINHSLQLLLFVTMPMTIGLSLLATPVWTVFYGYSELGSLVFRYSITMALFSSLLIILNVTMQSLNEYKKMFIYILIGFIFKVCSNIPLMYCFHWLGFHASYGSITASIAGHFITSILILRFLNKQFKVNYEQTLKYLLNIVLTVIIMAIIILLVQFIIKVDTTNRLLALGLVAFYSIIGIIIYLTITIKNKLLVNVFGQALINSVLSRFKLTKKIKN